MKCQQNLVPKPLKSLQNPQYTLPGCLKSRSLMRLYLTDYQKRLILRSITNRYQSSPLMLTVTHWRLP